MCRVREWAVLLAAGVSSVLPGSFHKMAVYETEKAHSWQKLDWVCSGGCWGINLWLDQWTRQAAQAGWAWEVVANVTYFLDQFMRARYSFNPEIFLLPLLISFPSDRELAQLFTDHLLLPFQFQYQSLIGYIFCFRLKIHRCLLCWPFSWPLINLVLLELALDVCNSKEQKQRATFRERCFSRVLTSTQFYFRCCTWL